MQDLNATYRCFWIGRRDWLGVLSSCTRHSASTKQSKNCGMERSDRASIHYALVNGVFVAYRCWNLFFDQPFRLVFNFYLGRMIWVRGNSMYNHKVSISFDLYSYSFCSSRSCLSEKLNLKIKQFIKKMPTSILWPWLPNNIKAYCPNLSKWKKKKSTVNTHSSNEQNLSYSREHITLVNRISAESGCVLCLEASVWCSPSEVVPQLDYW